MTTPQSACESLLRDIEFGPPETKLETMGRLRSAAPPLSEVRPAVLKVLLHAPDRSALRFFAAATLVGLGDGSDEVLDVLISFRAAPAFDPGRHEPLIEFPWLLEKQGYFPADLQLIGSLLKTSTQAAVVEALSHVRENPRATETLVSMLQLIKDKDWRAFVIYAIAAIGNPATRQQLDYYQEKFPNEIDGEAARIGLERFGQATLFEIAQFHRNVSPKKENSGCFIATAACGNEHAPEVITLRRFRDQHLLHHQFGRYVVHAYIVSSPPLARLITHSRLLRVIVRNAIVRPTAYLCALLPYVKRGF